MGAEVGRIRALGAELVAIAVTPTFAQMAFARHLGVDFPLLSDWEGEVAGAYGVRYDVWKGHRGLAKRSLFVVAPDGRIAYSWATDDALVLPEIEPAMAVLESLAISPA